MILGVFLRFNWLIEKNCMCLSDWPDDWSTNFFFVVNQKNSERKIYEQLCQRNTLLFSLRKHRGIVSQCLPPLFIMPLHRTEIHQNCSMGEKKFSISNSTVLHLIGRQQLNLPKSVEANRWNNTEYTYDTNLWRYDGLCCVTTEYHWRSFII